MRFAWFACLVACSSPAPGDPPPGDPPPDASAPAPPVAPLAVTSLGVQGFALSHGGDTILTAPLFTRQSVIEVALGVPLPADTAAIDAGLAGVELATVRGIVSGHAHYDHLMDVPRILERAPGATAYTNRSGRNMLAALAPDRPAGCTNTPAAPIARSRVVALDDAPASAVDWSNCPDLAPPGAPLAGTWVKVPGSNVRIMALCSMHPDQVGPFHFGEGSIDAEPCDLPAGAAGWLEGTTLAFLIDFLDATGAPVHRVFYQDAPTNAPVGHVPASIIAERAVDLALLCVGSNDAVDNAPTAVIENLRPRYILSGHWEDFFQHTGGAPEPLPFLDLATYVQRAEAGVPGAPDGELLVDGAPAVSRHTLAMPGMTASIPPRP